MKTGKTLVGLATEIERQAKSKRDFVAPTKKLAMVVERDNGAPVTAMDIAGQGVFPIQEIAHEQIATRVGIPQKYYERLNIEAPELLAINVNHWFQTKPEKRMVRTLDGKHRAFLSDRYRALDYVDTAETVLPIIEEMGCRVESAELTERRLYVKAVTEKVTFEIKKGDVVQAGIVVSNSEVGLGSVKVEPMIFRLVCLNGMVAADASIRKYHVGRGHDAGDLAEEFFRNETRVADDRAFWMKVQDVVRGAFRKEVFERLAQKMMDSTQDVIDADPVEVVEVVQKKFQLTDKERSGVLTHLIKGGDLSRYGLLNAVTRAAQDVDSYDRSTELERIGGVVLELPKHDWELIANADNN
jgi:hypothetical protein